jgi:K+-transporting ATPase ATPase C chain
MKLIIESLKLLLFMTILLGIVYPVFIFGVGKIIFPGKSTGSFVEINGDIVGSELFAQKFDSSIYFQPRPSVIDYQPMPSGASNLGPTSQKLKDISDSLRKAFITRNNLPENTIVPPDAIFASGSGIDPHISFENTVLQSNRISKARNFDTEKIQKLKELIDKNTENPFLGFIGEKRINVLLLNIELDKL